MVMWVYTFDASKWLKATSKTREKYWWPLMASQGGWEFGALSAMVFATYGGVAIAFHALDADGSGSLSEEEFVTVIQNSSFKGGGETM